MTEDMPLGFSEAAKDWNVDYAGRQMTYADWGQLTLGEQLSYAAQECKTKGAIFSSSINATEIRFSVTLPHNLALNGLTAEEAEGLEWYLHREMEKQISAMIQIKQMRLKGTLS